MAFILKRFHLSYKDTSFWRKSIACEPLLDSKRRRNLHRLLHHADLKKRVIRVQVEVRLCFGYKKTGKGKLNSLPDTSTRPPYTSEARKTIVVKKSLVLIRKTISA
jgi:hypothetical protein